MRQDSASKDQHVRGVFSSQEVRKVGTGTTTRKTVQKVFWFVEQHDDNTIFLQPLNTNYIPTGSKREISMDELLEKFSPEPEFYVQSVFPKLKELEESVNRGDDHREKGENFSAEYEYTTALNLDEESVKANFGIGLTYLARGEVDKADNIFERLVHLEAAFEEQHKHLFNDFGINLRKNKMYPQAVAYYKRALELTQADDHLHINMARAYMEEQNYMGCVRHILEALALAPDNDTAAKFLAWLDKNKKIPKELQSQCQPHLDKFAAAADEAANEESFEDAARRDGDIAQKVTNAVNKAGEAAGNKGTSIA